MRIPYTPSGVCHLVHEETWLREHENKELKSHRRGGSWTLKQFEHMDLGINKCCKYGNKAACKIQKFF